MHHQHTGLCFPRSAYEWPNERARLSRFVACQNLEEESTVVRPRSSGKGPIGVRCARHSAHRSRLRDGLGGGACLSQRERQARCVSGEERRAAFRSIPRVGLDQTKGRDMEAGGCIRPTPQTGKRDTTAERSGRAERQTAETESARWRHALTLTSLHDLVQSTLVSFATTLSDHAKRHGNSAVRLHSSLANTVTAASHECPARSTRLCIHHA